MAMDDAKRGGAFKRGPIQRGSHVLQRLIGCMAPHIHDRMFLGMIRPAC